MTKRNWRPVTQDKPCPSCRKQDWCAWSSEGWLKCERCSDEVPGLVRVKAKDGGAIYRPLNDRDLCPRRTRRDSRHSNGQNSSGKKPAPPRGAAANDRPDLEAEAERFIATLTEASLLQLAETLGVSASALSVLGVGWAASVELRRLGASGAGWPDDYPIGAFSFPERDGAGRLVGFGFRAPDGRKGAPSAKKAGTSRGLVIPRTLRDRPDPVLIVEGASDVAACESLGLSAVGRPSNSGGAEDLARLVKGRRILVLGERDQKETGAWPGRDGAERVAEALANEWREPVNWSLPPEGFKDVRAWLQGRVAAGLSLADAEACKAAGVELIAALEADTEEASPEKEPSQSEKLVRLALERYRIGLSESDEAFAVARDGPNVALMFRGSREALRAALARDYRQRYRRVPNAAALKDALVVLEGEAQQCEREPVFLRAAEHDGAIVLDLAGADGRAVLIEEGSWKVVDCSPVLFRRTALTGELPEPQRGGTLDLLRDLLNVTDETWPVVLGWLVAAFFPNLPRPILILGGLQGAGKSTATGFLVPVFDPSPALLRSQPKDVEQWAISAAGSYAVAVDNVSAIPLWWSDSLCKAVTGDGWVRRKLWTDGELAVLSFRRVIVLTSIDPGALRGDLGDRLLMGDLEPIPDSTRRTEAELNQLFAERQPLILGAVLDLVAAVLKRLPHVQLPALPRMADFARILATMDEVARTASLPRYLGQRGRIAADVVDGDPVGSAVTRFMEGVSRWSGTATELLSQITPEKPPRGWPGAGHVLSARLKRLTPALTIQGITVERDRKTDSARSKIIRLERVPQPSVPSVRASDGSEEPRSVDEKSDSASKPSPDASSDPEPVERPAQASGAEGRSDGPAPASDAPNASDASCDRVSSLGDADFSDDWKAATELLPGMGADPTAWARR